MTATTPSPVTESMVAKCVQAMKILEDAATTDPENIFGASLTSLARACLTAALDGMVAQGWRPAAPGATVEN